MSSSGTQISDMTPSATLPAGSFAPFIVTIAATGLNPTSNYRFDLGTDIATIKTDILTKVSSAALAASGGSALVGFISGGTGAVATTVQAKLRRIQVDLEDFGGGTGVSDNTAAFRKAMTALETAGGGMLQLGAGTYELASATLGGTGLELPANVTIQGRGKGVTTLEVTGTTQCYVFLNQEGRSNQLISDLTCIGNSVADANGPGGFYAVLLSAASNNQADVENCVVSNVRMENFKGDAWILFYARDNNLVIRNSGVGWGCEAVSRDGNCRAPNNLNILSYVVEFLGRYTGVIQDPFVNGLWADLTYIKGGIIAFSNVRNLMIRTPVLLDAFQGEQVADKGAYAILLYDFEEVVTNTVIDAPIIQNPFSCGIYMAGTTQTTISHPHIWGQADVADGTLPKAAISLNGPLNVKITNPLLYDNYHDIALVGTVTGYAEEQNITILGGSGRGASDCSVTIMPSPNHPARGIKFIGFEGIDAADSGLAAFPSSGTALGVVDLDLTDCNWGGANYGVNLNRGAVTSHNSDGIRMSGGSVVQAGTDSIRCLGIASGKTITVSDVSFSASSVRHINLNTADRVSITGNIFYGSASTANMSLEACKGPFGGNLAYNGSVLVEATANGLGRAIPTWSGYYGMRVQNVLAAAGDYGEWINLGTTTWKGVGQIAA